MHDVMMSWTCACSGLLLRLQDWDPMMCFGFDIFVGVPQSCYGEVGCLLRAMKVACLAVVVS